jgi:hypothetical protein
MGVVNTTYTFTGTDTITSSKLNNIIDQTTFTNDSIQGTTLQVVSGKLAVRAGNITSSELASNSVVTAKIADSNVITAKIANSAVTTEKIANSAVTKAKILNANVTAAKLDGEQTGSAPIYGIRAWGYVDAGGNLIRGEGIESTSKVTTGHYSITLATSAGKMFCAVASCDESNNFNNSAKVNVTTFSNFRVFTGFDDAVSPSDSGFHFMVIY